MNFINEIKMFVRDGLVVEESVDFLGDITSAIMGDKVSAGKLILALGKAPFLIREQIFWSKLETFLDGVYLEEKDCAILRAKLTENGEKQENAFRLVECIDRAETKQKIKYLVKF